MSTPVAEPVDLIDFDTEFEGLVQQLKDEAEARLAPPEMSIYDGDANLRAIIRNEISANIAWLHNEVGTAVIDLPVDYYLAEWLIDVDNRETSQAILRVDKDGARWTGLLEEIQIHHTDSGTRFVRAIFKHDLQHLHHIFAWSNPFLPAELQLPRLWMCFSQHIRWAIKTTMLVNIMRLESSLWMLPDDPLDPAGWFDFNQANWSMVVKPDLPDNPDRSPAGVIHSRFKSMYEATKRAVQDAQLTWEPRRYFPGDPEPWPGAQIAYGTIVWDLVDNSAFTTGTSFGGTLFDGLWHELVNIGGDGKTETTETVPDPNMPDLYKTAGALGSDPSVPAVVWRDGEHSAIQASMFSHRPAGPVGVVGGGHSAPGINEGISATIISLAGFLGSMVGQSQIGPAIDAVLRPIYMDTVGAFGKWKNIVRAQRLGKHHLHERWADGADRAYTLSWVLAMRTAMFATRETTRCTITVADGAPWRIGQRGFGHCFLGTRVGFTIRELPGRIFVEQISELRLAWDRKTAPLWKIQIGQREPEDPVLKAFEILQDFLGMLRDLGVL